MKHWASLLALLTLMGASVAPAGAQNNKAAPLVTPYTDTDIALAGQVVMRMREGAGGFTPEQRAAIIRGRLIPILSIRGLDPGDVRVRLQDNGRLATIWVRDHFLVTAGGPVARANNTTPEALARQWAKNLQDTLPKMAVKAE